MLIEDEVSEKMMDIGRRLYDEFDKAGSLKLKLAAAAGVERAFRLALDSGRGSDPIFSCEAITMAFLAQVGSEIMRSSLYLQYMKFCDATGFSPVGKAALFSALPNYGFKLKRKNTGEFVIPPRQKHPELVRAQRLLPRIFPSAFEDVEADDQSTLP